MRDRRTRLPRLAAATATVLLGLLTAAYAATGRLPVGGERTAARAVALQPTGPIIANGAAGRAVVSAVGMAPGSSVRGDVTIGNEGDLPGDFTLALTGLADTAVPGERLSSVLLLRVDDVTSGGQPVTRYAGPLAALRTVAVGRIAPAAHRVFRFTVSFPGGRPSALDNALQGARTTASFAWLATGAGGPPYAGQSRPPSASLRAARRQRPTRGRVLAVLRCSAACRAIVSGAVRVSGVRRVVRTRTVRVTLRRGGSRRLVVRLPRGARAGGRRAVSLQLRLQARVGGRTVVARRTVRLAR